MLPNTCISNLPQVHKDRPKWSKDSVGSWTSVFQLCSSDPSKVSLSRTALHHFESRVCWFGLFMPCPRSAKRHFKKKKDETEDKWWIGRSRSFQCGAVESFLEIHVKIGVALHRCDPNSFQIFTSDMARWLGSCWNPLKNLKYRFVKVLVNAVLVFGMRHSMLSLGSGVACDFRHVVSAKKILQHQGRHQNLKPYSPIPRMPSNKLHPDPNDLVPGFFVWQPGRLGKSAKRFAANIGDGAMGPAYCEHVLNLFLWRPENARPFLTPGYCGSWAHFFYGNCILMVVNYILQHWKITIGQECLKPLV